MISARFSTAEETLNSAISRATVSSGSMSRIFSTLTSLWSCFITWSIGCTAPSRVRVIREIVGSSVGPTARVSMLKPRREKSPATRARTPGLFSTRIERMCLRPVSWPGRCRSSSLTVWGVPASIRSPRSFAHLTLARRLDHVAGGAARRDHRVAVLFLGDADVQQDRALGLERGDHLLLEVGGVLAAHPFGAERLR